MVIRLTALLALSLVKTAAETFTVGYLTGSQRLPNDHEYSKPGKQISGAITHAVNEVNQPTGILGSRGLTLRFISAETFGNERESILQTANLWTRNISAYVGPQETCVHEGRMAAAFNLPMISYFCADHATSDKEKFPTFARTRPPDSQISKSVISVLEHFNWKHVVLLYLNASCDEYGRVGETILDTLKANQIHVEAVRSWDHIYHVGYEDSPFKRILLDTFQNTRIYVILGYYQEHLGLLLAMRELNLLEKGDYFVVGVNLEMYNDKDPAAYFRDILKKHPEPHAHEVYQSYLGVAPRPPEPHQFARFASLVNYYLEKPPFNFPNPLNILGVAKQIRPEAAYLYDAIQVYSRALVKVMDAGEDPYDGGAIFRAMRNMHYHSAMGYMVYMDSNGDAEGNYTLLARQFSNKTNQYGLFPVGAFQLTSNVSIPVLKLTKEIDWVAAGPPIAVLPCGFNGEKCITHIREIITVILSAIAVFFLVIVIILYRNWKYEQELDSLLWKVNYRELDVHDEDNPTKSNANAGKVTRSSHPLIRTSQVSLSSNPDADFRYSSIFTTICIYKGRIYAMKKVNKKSIDITRQMKKELKTLRDLRHNNLNAFVGACTEAPNICIISEYCSRGSLKDILENDEVKLDNMFVASIVFDILRGVIYLHDSPLKFHGFLCPSNCLVDSRWVVKITDFGLNEFKKGADESKKFETIDAKCEYLLYRAPELLRTHDEYEKRGSQKGDVYSFSIILYELHSRKGPFGEMGMSTPQILHRVMNYKGPYLRPNLECLENRFDCVCDCLKECWAENPDERPDFKSIRTRLRPLRKGMKPNIFDNMMAMMEKYANNLEVLVDERTDQLQQEKRKTEALLLEMLPRPVAEQLKRNNKVEAESYECVTIYFSDIVGFTAMSAESTPLEVVDFLNDLYTCFDSIIENYDVYKVETIGDAYMVVSGLPIRNGDQHAAEIASMSLHLLAAVRNFKIRHRPEQQLRLRIGIHSGPVCAGVVGLKMPRYCLFGDTVNTTSRMESTGEALKIHCSRQCKKLLDKLGGYIVTERGKIEMKGKGEQTTYWLLGEDEIMQVMRNDERLTRKRVKHDALEKPLTPGMPRSSLKNRSALVRSPMPRCSSLESPKRLRFASGDRLELFHYKYSKHSRDYVLESIADNSPVKKSMGSFNEPDGDTFKTSSSSCPCMENLANSTCTMTTGNSQLSMFPKENALMVVNEKVLFNSVPLLLCPHAKARNVACSMPSSPMRHISSLVLSSQFLTFPVQNAEHPVTASTPLLSAGSVERCDRDGLTGIYRNFQY